jgi:GNAT superfamily N-acetyltransferase
MYTEALPRRRQRNTPANAPFLSDALMEEPTAAAVFLTDRRSGQATGYLSLLHCVNDLESLERFWGEVVEYAWSAGCQRVLGPTALSPYLAGGVLHNYFHVQPPLHTPYNPPYVPELIDSILEPVAASQLYSARVPATVPVLVGPAEIVPFDAARLAADLLPLFAAASPLETQLPPPDTAEVTFLLNWLRVGPVFGWLAQIKDQPVGFILLQPDLAAALKRANGGRTLPWRLWLQWRSRRRVYQGRLLYSAVLPAWRNQGVGRQLWAYALQFAQEQGWQSLAIGPVPPDSPASSFLTKQGAAAQQRYVLYGSEL